MVAYTTTYNLKKPTVADDEDVWGGYLNDSMDLIDDVLDGTTPVTGIDINSGTIDNAVIGGTTPVAGTFSTLTANTSLGVTGNITVSGTVDGRDVAADGTKLDGIESGATADQTKADIDALGINAATLDSLDSTQFLRSDASDTVAGDITVTGLTRFANNGNNPYFWFTESSVDKAYIQWNANGYIELGNVEDGSRLVIKDNFEVSTDNGASWNSIWHAGNDGTGSGLDADLWDGNQFSTYLNQAVLSSSSPNFNNLYINDYLIHTGDSDTYLGFGTNTISLVAGNSAEVTINTTGVRLGDTGNGYFQPVSGSYGSIQIDGGAHGGYEGYSIGGRAVFMHNNSSTTGIYNDVDNEWLIDFTHNGDTRLYNNGAVKVQISSSYMEMLQHIDMNNYNIYGVDRMFHHGDTDTYMQFHAANQWRVVTGGTERIEVNNTRTQIDTLLTDAAVAEDYDALSGTSVTADPDAGGAFSLTMTGNTTFTFGAPSLGSGVSTGFIIELTGNGSTVTWPSSVEWAGGTAPDAPANGETDIYVFWTRDGGTTWYGVQSIDAAA
jgi:hypothetical protein